MLAILLVACGGGGDAPLDGGGAVDAAADAEGDAQIVAVPLEPEAPRLAPCPDGWRELGGVCEPLPAVDPASCPPGEAIFPGDAGCTPIGTPCTSDPWAADLPEEAESSIRFVAPGGTGSGTRDDPMGSIAEALEAPDRDGIVAIARGTYREAVSLPAGRTLWGACAAETHIEAPSASESAGTVTVEGAGTSVKNLSITGDRAAVWVVGSRRDVTLEGVVIDAASYLGWVVASGAAATGRDVVVRGTRAGSNGRFGHGINVQGASLDLTRAVVEGNRHVGLSLDEAAIGRITDTVIRGTLPEAASGTFGRGLNVQGDAEGTLERVVVEGNREVSVFVSRGRLDATDLVVRDTIFDEDYESGDGLHVREDASVALRRARFDRNVRVGMAIRGPGASLVVEDAVVTDTLEQPDGQYGQGLLVLDGSIVETSRLVIERSRHVGASFDGDVAATLVDLSVVQTLGQTSDGWFGRGLNAQGGAQVTLERVRLAQNRDVGLYVSGEGTRVTALDCQIVETLPRTCAESSCIDAAAGVAAGAYEHATLEIERFRIADAALCGVQVAREASVDLTEGEVAACPIGANVQVEGYDFARISRRVVYRDNGTNLDASELPVPPAQDVQDL